MNEITVNIEGGGNFPPYKITRRKLIPIEDNFLYHHDNLRAYHTVYFAVAGISYYDLEITENNYPSHMIEIKKKDREILSSPPSNLFGEYEILHNGIAERKFTIQIHIKENISLIDTRLEEGILRLSFDEKCPEEAKPKKIKINT